MKEISKPLKVTIIFLIYILYITLFDKMFNCIGITSTLSMIISDLIFLTIIIIMYKENIKENYKKINEIPVKEVVKKIFKYLGILILTNIIMGIFTELFLPNISHGNDENSNYILELLNSSYYYTLFKTLIFATIAEELLFKEAIRSVVKNNILFVIISTVIYTAMNFIYADFSTSTVFIDMLGYIIFSSILSIIYIQNDDNVILTMIIKFLYNIIPTIILIITMIVGVNA